MYEIDIGKLDAGIWQHEFCYLCQENNFGKNKEV